MGNWDVEKEDSDAERTIYTPSKSNDDVQLFVNHGYVTLDADTIWLNTDKNRVKTELDQARNTLRNAAWLGTNEDRERIEKAVELLCREPCEELPSAQHEPSGITDEQAIRHLQSTGWMQNHDREMYESGLREKLADDSGSYDSLIPCKDAISRQAAHEAVYSANGLAGAMKNIDALPPVTPKQRTGHCKDCKYFEYDSKIDGLPFIVAHEICSRWGDDGCKTKEDGYCFLFEPQESEGNK